MKSLRRFAPAIFLFFIMVGSGRLLKEHFSIIALVIFALSFLLLVFLILRPLVKGQLHPKYQRKPASPWSALNDGIDPSL